MQGSAFQGRRIKDTEGNLCEPGDYYKDAVGDWRGQTPNCLYVWLRNHHIEEHDDGTISVVSGAWGSNSILASDGRRELWHGYIERGVWRAC